MCGFIAVVDLLTGSGHRCSHERYRRSDSRSNGELRGGDWWTITAGQVHTEPQRPRHSPVFNPWEEECSHCQRGRSNENGGGGDFCNRNIRQYGERLRSRRRKDPYSLLKGNTIDSSRWKPRTMPRGETRPTCLCVSPLPERF